MVEWSLIQDFLAVARTGSTLAAARQLGVNQTTVARRIAALEAALGLRLFDRAAGGYRPSEAGAGLIAQAEKVEEAAEQFARQAVQRGRKLEGAIRVTTNESLANIFVTPWLAEFQALYPDIRIELIVCDRYLDLASGEADMALRPGRPGDAETLLRRKLSDLPWAVYCSPGYAARYGVPSGVAAMAGHRVIGGDGWLGDLPPMRWLLARAPSGSVVTTCSTLTNLVVAVRAGLGLSALPCAATVQTPELRRCFLISELHYELVLLTRPELRDAPRVRVFNDFIATRAAAMRHLIEGRTAE